MSGLGFNLGVLVGIGFYAVLSPAAIGPCWHGPDTVGTNIDELFPFLPIFRISSSMQKFIAACQHS